MARFAGQRVQRPRTGREHHLYLTQSRSRGGLALELTVQRGVQTDRGCHHELSTTLAPPDAQLQRELETQTTCEVRFDRISRALYSTDASVYQIAPAGVVV